VVCKTIEINKHQKDKFVPKTSSILLDKELPSQQTISQEVSIAQEQEAKIKALDNEIKLAKKELETAKVKAIAYSNIVDIADIAEKEFNISIRKK